MNTLIESPEIRDVPNRGNRRAERGCTTGGRDPAGNYPDEIMQFLRTVYLVTSDRSRS